MADSLDVWALIDDRAGHNSQALGVAAKLGIPYAIKKIDYSWLAKSPNRFIGKSGLSIQSECREQLQAPWPKIVIAAGRRLAPVSRYIKSQSPDTMLVQLMWPGDACDDFAVIAVPEHDDVPDKNNIIRTTAALHAVTAERLEVARTQWHNAFSDKQEPRIAMLVGGNSKHGSFTDDDFTALCALSNHLATNGSLLITTSRRTDPAVERKIEQNITVPHYFHCYDDKQENPYFGIIACADAIIVTGDSISMCSEACMAGKPVFIYIPEHIKSDKLARFHQTLYDKGHAQPLNSSSTLDWQPPFPVDDASVIAERILHYMNAR